MRNWKHHPSRLAYKSGRFRVLEDPWTRPDGVRVIFPLLRSPSFSCVVGLTDDHEVPLVENLHPSPGLHLLEIPGGRVEPGETARAAARRELEEETGWNARTLLPIGRYYPNSHWGTFQGRFFLGERLRRGSPHPDPGESVRPILLPVGEVYRRLHRGRFLAGSTIVGLHLAENLLRQRGFLPRGRPPRRSELGGRRP
jgi:ADP-ribose pyrophosphatase